MYIWNLEKVTAEIKDRPFTEAELFPYFLVYTALYSPIIIPVMGTVTYNLWDTVMGVIYFFISLIATYYIYRKNGGPNGKDFVQKYLTIGFVFWVRWVVFVALPVTVIWMFFLLSDTTTTQLFDVVIFSLLSAHYYWRLGVYLGKLREEEKMKVVPPEVA
jgi:hypothetical protein